MKNKFEVIIFLIFIIILFISLLINIYLSQKYYYCEDNKTIKKCTHFSKYYGLENGKCYNVINGNQVCKTGWWDIQKNKIINTTKIMSD